MANVRRAEIRSAPLVAAARLAAYSGSLRNRLSTFRGGVDNPADRCTLKDMDSDSGQTMDALFANFGDKAWRIGICAQEEDQP